MSLLLNQQERDLGLTVEELNKRIMAKDETGVLIQERKKAHGDWHKQAALAQHLKSIVTVTDNELEPHQQEAIEMICVKISRILTGDPNHADHWDDIAGYARLGKQGHE